MRAGRERRSGGSRSSSSISGCGSKCAVLYVANETNRQRQGQGKGQTGTERKERNEMTERREREATHVSESNDGRHSYGPDLQTVVVVAGHQFTVLGGGRRGKQSRQLAVVGN